MREKLTAYGHERWLCITELGGKCKSCGNDDYEVLELDHIRGDGCLEGDRNKYGFRRGGGGIGPFRQARLSGRLSEIYQVLCGNCHTRKTKQSGEHSRGRGNKRSRDITNIETPTLPLFDWGEIPPFAEIPLGLPK